MKMHFIAGLGLSLLLAVQAQADDLPFFSALRAEVVNQLVVASNTPPLNKKLVTSLQVNLKTLDKTKPTLMTGSATLGTLAKALGKTSLSNIFLPILTGTRTVYLEVMESDMGALEERLSHTIPGKAKTAARTSLHKLAAEIEGTSTNANFILSLKSLSKAAKALAIAEKAVVKAETAKPGANFLTATITESNQGTTPFQITKSRSTFLYADYYPDYGGGGTIDIGAGDGKKLGGSRVQLRALYFLSIMVPGEGTHTLSLTNEGYADYTRTIAPNIDEFKSDDPDFEFQERYFVVNPFNERQGTGSLTITHDLDANHVWGDFTFTASGQYDSNLTVSITGSFLIRLTIDDDDDDDDE